MTFLVSQYTFMVYGPVWQNFWGGTFFSCILLVLAHLTSPFLALPIRYRQNIRMAQVWHRYSNVKHFKTKYRKIFFYVVAFIKTTLLNEIYGLLGSSVKSIRSCF